MVFDGEGRAEGQHSQQDHHGECGCGSSVPTVHAGHTARVETDAPAFPLRLHPFYVCESIMFSYCAPKTFNGVLQVKDFTFIFMGLSKVRFPSKNCGHSDSWLKLQDTVADKSLQQEELP